MRMRGFTLVELVMVITITGILAASVTIFLKPAIDSYFDTRRRADLTDIADTALRRMAQDIRRAVPNSAAALAGGTCLRLVPTIAGGRYRMAEDTVAAAGSSTPLDSTTATAGFDVLSPLAEGAAGDWVVINNQNGGDVYAGTNRGRISDVTVPATTAGQHHITLNPAQQFPTGYDGGRFVIVADAEPVVFYSCVGNTLFRTVAAFDAPDAATCAAFAGAVVATDVANCTFVYDPNQGATQQSGFVWMRLELSRAGESVSLAHGVHVDNAP